MNVDLVRPSHPLTDEFGRQATDLRVSLTDKCNLRCTYCMPAEGLQWLPNDRVLSDTEFVRLVRIATERCGVTSVRFTGGEPLVRAGVVDIIRAAAALVARPEVSMTTNGLNLTPQKATSLAEAGLRRVNVSLDTLRPERFKALTRRDGLERVLESLRILKAAGLTPVKVNAVLMRGVNDDEASDLLEYCLAHGYQLRFIEQMPLDAEHHWNREQMVTAAEILHRLSTRFDLVAFGQRGSSPAQRFIVNHGEGTVGIIASVSKPFCRACDRTRLTADGHVRSCLFSQDETDLRTMMRSGASDEQLASAWAATMATKPAGHKVGSSEFRQPARPMSAIGG
jgi:cyclic pyranopterin phosphate synthase